MATPVVPFVRALPLVALAACLAASAAGCAPDDSDADDPRLSGIDSSAAAVQGHPINAVVPAACRGAATVARPAASGPAYQNPLVEPFSAQDYGCGDPTIQYDGPRHRYLLYCESYSAPDAYPIFESDDLARWHRAAGDGAVFPGRNRWPSWTTAPSTFWAPSAHYRGDGVYLLYFAAPCVAGADWRECIGVAQARDPAGPWHDRGTPLVNDPHHGTIDPSLLVDDADPSRVRRYLYWVHQADRIVAQELRADGLGFVAPHAAPREVLWAGGTPETRWEEAVAEQPYAVRHGRYYYLFYSGASYLSSYGIGVARATSPLGPFVKRGPPIVHADDAQHWIAPGGSSLLRDAHGHDLLVYHAIRRPSDQEIAQIRWRDVPGSPDRIECERPDGRVVQMRRGARVHNPYCRRQDDRLAVIDPLVWEPDPCEPGAFWPRVPGDVPSHGRVNLP